MANDTPWDATHMPSMAGKTAIVTGANSGIGFVTALELARHGAHVVLACRSEAKGKDAVQKIQQELIVSPDAGSVEFRKLDVSSLASVKAFAETSRQSHDKLDLLINNAGVMAVPYSETVDGIESQFATNHLGHFALTSHLFSLLRKTEGVARVVNLSSITHWLARMDVDRIVSPEKGYRAIQVYANSKLYNILFIKELDRRLRAEGIRNVLAVACHPGYSYSNLTSVPATKSNWFMRFWWGVFNTLPLGQPCEIGALPTLYAATAENITGGEYIGPDGYVPVRGHPCVETPRNDSESLEGAKKLWEESEKLAKITFTIS